MILQWSQNKIPLIKLLWEGPNILTGLKVETLQHLNSVITETKIAVITGPKGNKGDKGDPGVTSVMEGTGDLTFSWSPPEAQAIWVINHTFNKYPSVTVTDSSGSIVIPEITYLSINLVQISFAYPTSGTAYLN